jgi:hypothetical protein
MAFSSDAATACKKVALMTAADEGNTAHQRPDVCDGLCEADRHSASLHCALSAVLTDVSLA